MNQFWIEIRDIVGESGYSADPWSETCVAGFTRKVAGSIRPQTKEQLPQILKLANEHHVPLYPYSTGKNWGMGSKNPAKDGSVRLDLSCLNRIIRVDTDLGFAIIEPGVTQEQLSRHLERVGSKFFIDVTGSDADTSILGNALERGIGYNLPRVETIQQLEVLLGTGQVVKTGFSRIGDGDLNHLYKYGVGPSIEGLFFQSNFGIVLSGTVLLLPRPQKIVSFLIHVDRPELVPELCVKLQELMLSGDLTCIPHIFNRNRLFPALAPHVYQYFSEVGKTKTPAEIESLLQKEIPYQWVGAGNIKGDKHQVSYLERKMKRQLRPYGKVLFFNDWTKRLSQWASLLPGLHGKKALMYANKPLGDLTQGRPTHATMASIQWPILGPNYSKESLTDPDKFEAGFVYCLPFAPLTVSGVNTMTDVVDRVCKKHGFDPAVTLNLVTSRLVEAVVSLSFNKTRPGQLNDTRRAMRELQAELIQTGCYPYRTNIDLMDQIYGADTEIGKLLKSLKGVFDPNGIISPGRYVD